MSTPRLVGEISVPAASTAPSPVVAAADPDGAARLFARRSAPDAPPDETASDDVSRLLRRRADAAIPEPAKEP